MTKKKEKKLLFPLDHLSIFSSIFLVLQNQKIIWVTDIHI